MANLLEDRVTPSTALHLRSGLFGPYVTKECRKERTRYGALFCMPRKQSSSYWNGPLAQDWLLQSLLYFAISSAVAVQSERWGVTTVPISLVWNESYVRPSARWTTKRLRRSSAINRLIGSSTLLLQVTWAECGKDKFRLHVDSLISFDWFYCQPRNWEGRTCKCFWVNKYLKRVQIFGYVHFR